MGFPLSFIHVGLPKCASTFLQNVWKEDPQYHIGNASQLVELARMYVSRGLVDSIPYNSVTKPEAALQDRTVIASSEGFTWDFCNQPEKQGLLDDMHRASARLLGKAGLSDTILIMVRNPVDMVRALHEQSVKQGGVEPFEVFARKQRQFILGPLNLELILEEYGRFFPRVVVLSADELRTDPVSFWKKFSRQVQAPEPLPESLESCLRKLTANRSLGPRISDLVEINRHSFRFADIFCGLQGYAEDHPEEYVEFSAFCQTKWYWPSRRVAEYATEEQLDSLLGDRSKQVADSFGQIRLEGVVVEAIQEKFLKPLAQHGVLEEKLIQEYGDSLDQAAVD